MKRQILLLAALTITAMMLSAQNKTALVIGNGEYENNFAALANPVPEARRMAAALEDIGFKVIRAYNVQNQERFDALFAMFEEEIKARGGIALFHYGGHGVQVDGQNYLLPTERDIPDERRARTRGINVADVVSAMESARADANIVILDACRENPFGRGAARGLARVDAPPNSIVVYAADAGETAQDGLFTPTLLKYLTRPGMSLTDILMNTRRDVRQASGNRQRPGEYSMLETDIYLAGSSSSAPARPNAPSFSLEQSYGSLEVSVQTPGTLYLDGKSMGRIPPGSRARLTDIPAGRHNLEMRYGGKSESKTITVQVNRFLAVAFSWVERPDGLEGYVLVEGGTFRMGSPSNEVSRDDDEEPQHSVTVGSFYMKATEVTHQEFLAFLNSAGVSRTGELNGNEIIDMDDEDVAIAYSGGQFKFTGSSYAASLNTPVIEQTWYGAVEYCNWLSKEEGRTPVYRINGSSVTANWSADGYRLPTEAEWEYAARGGKKSRGYKYSGSNSAGSVGWYDENSGSKTHPVGQKQANELGLYDMSGNVREWCWDWYGDYSSGSQRDPRGPSSGSRRVYRGGSWYYPGWSLRSADRYDNSPGISYRNFGFRPVRRT